MGQRFFTALALARGESPAAQTGPLVAGLLREHGIHAGIGAALPGHGLASRPARGKGVERAARGGVGGDRARRPTSRCAAWAPIT